MVRLTTLAMLVLGQATLLNAEQLISLRNGMVLRGVYLEIAGMNQNAFSAAGEGGIQNRPIWVV
ncbi:MAG: hypothetical protein ACF8AM_02390, partial [Rhodopirellula sp. JB055]|uniref:hypothetical protein n=1 Tax=Rhodopirellula sp. JB055 TaxID=3342846 RepID=UPI00370A8AEE